MTPMNDEISKGKSEQFKTLAKEQNIPIIEVPVVTLEMLEDALIEEYNKVAKYIPYDWVEN